MTGFTPDDSRCSSRQGQKAAESKARQKSLFALSRPSRCFNCDKRLLVDEIVKLLDKQEDKEVYCLVCANLAGFELLKAGNAPLTRLAKKYSREHFVVLKWSELWKTYERIGLLVETMALEKAAAELKDCQ